MELKVTKGLKRDVVSALAKETHVGMAHFAGSGPDGKTCRQCAHYRFEGYNARTRMLRDAGCAKGHGQKFPCTASACKHFEANPRPPAPQQPFAVF